MVELVISGQVPLYSVILNQMSFPLASYSLDLIIFCANKFISKDYSIQM